MEAYPEFVLMPEKDDEQGYRIWSDSLDMGPILANGHDRIRNWATNAAALWLPESGISARRPEKKSICDSPVLPIGGHHQRRPPGV